jgi:hypothetical protein
MYIVIWHHLFLEINQLMNESLDPRSTIKHFVFYPRCFLVEDPDKILRFSRDLRL